MAPRGIGGGQAPPVPPTSLAHGPPFPKSEGVRTIMEFGEAIKNPAYRIFQTEYSGCLDISAHA